MKVGQSVLSAASCSLLTGRCAVVSRPAVCSEQQAVSVVRRASRGEWCALVSGQWSSSVDRQPLLVARRAAVSGQWSLLVARRAASVVRPLLE